jgi:hypothetical protein
MCFILNYLTRAFFFRIKHYVERDAQNKDVDRSLLTLLVGPTKQHAPLLAVDCPRRPSAFFNRVKETPWWAREEIEVRFSSLESMKCLFHSKQLDSQVDT